LDNWGGGGKKKIGERERERDRLAPKTHRTG